MEPVYVITVIGLCGCKWTINHGKTFQSLQFNQRFFSISEDETPEPSAAFSLVVLRSILYNTWTGFGLSGDEKPSRASLQGSCHTQSITMENF